MTRFIGELIRRKTSKEGRTLTSADKDISFLTVMETCTHKEDQCVIVKEAEQVAILRDHQRNLVHVSLHRGGWFSCKTYPVEFYSQLTPAEELKLIQARLGDFAGLQE